MRCFKMRCFVLFVSLFGVASSLSCGTCGELNWADIEEATAAAAGLPTTVGDYPKCNTPLDMTCESDLQKCGNMTLSMSIAFGGSVSLYFSTQLEGCVYPDVTCASYEEEILKGADGPGMEGYELEVMDCDFQMDGVDVHNDIASSSRKSGVDSESYDDNASEDDDNANDDVSEHDVFDDNIDQDNNIQNLTTHDETPTIEPENSAAIIVYIVLAVVVVVFMSCCCCCLWLGACCCSRARNRQSETRVIAQPVTYNHSSGNVGMPSNQAKAPCPPMQGEYHVPNNLPRNYPPPGSPNTYSLDIHPHPTTLSPPGPLQGGYPIPPSQRPPDPAIPTFPPPVYQYTENIYHNDEEENIYCEDIDDNIYADAYEVPDVVPKQK